MKPIIKIENLSKQYRLGNIGTGTLAHDLKRWWTTSVRGKEDPYLKIGDTNDRSRKGSSEYVWALKDINLEVMPGEVLGIIGKNGAGKSTLLKILSKVTGPTTGKIHYNGRIGSLLEVGTGFHSEMTGRENIFLNGAILGMTKAEIRKKLDEIIDFSGCERYIDTPVKRYSSGMMVRLGFAVAAHLEPEILVVDEVLAVGDTEFQKKAIGKMQDISSNDGRTILFVSHNLTAICDLCTKGILLTNGSITLKDNIQNVVVKYLSILEDFKKEKSWIGDDAPGNEYIKVRKVYIVNKNFEKIDHALIDQEIGFCVQYEVLEDIQNFIHSINVYNSMKTHLFTSHDDFENNNSTVKVKGMYQITVWIPSDLLQDDRFEFSFACLRYNPLVILFHEKLFLFNLLDPINTKTRNKNYHGVLPGLIRPLLKWDIIKI